MKISPFLSQHINLTERILEKAVSEKSDNKEKAGEAVNISDESSKKRIMHQLIERIVAGKDDPEKGS
jgi:hypothetical protein